MKFKYNDGGRSEAGFKGHSGDCAVRAIAIATQKPYMEVYNAINLLAKSERITKRKKSKSSARDGVYTATMRRYIESIGWKWTPTMLIGQGCKVHLHDGELPDGRLIVRVSKHFTAVIDQVINDTHDPQRETLVVEGGVKSIARRCVYGYWQPNN